METPLSPAPSVTVVIPSYNRKESVLRTLHSLANQTLPPDQFEVIVVDDGSKYDAQEVTQHTFPFSFFYLRQSNQGATIARNNGVKQSRGGVLVFIDDDVTVSPPTLAALAEALYREPHRLVMGTLVSRSNGTPSLFTQDALELANGRSHIGLAHDQEVAFTESNTQLLAVKREDFFALGMLQDPTGGWPNWDDVDFGYRAHLAGFCLVQSAQAVGEHWDYSLAELGAACRRWQRASKSAVRLFRVHPGLQPHIPMLHDKTPIVWGQDSAKTVLRKMVRRFTALSPVLWGMEQTVTLLERYYPSPAFLRTLYRWIQGSYMVRGYQEGLRELRSVS